MDEIEKMRRDAWADRHAGMRFEKSDGTWTDARGLPADPPDEDGGGFAERRDADRRRWAR